MDLTVDAFRRVNDINVIGTFLCIREAAKRMRSGGRICTVASVAGKRGGGLSVAAYAASKGGVLALSRTPRGRWRRSGSPSTASPGADAHPSWTNPSRMPSSANGRIDDPARTAGEPHEIAEAIAWLLSPRSSYVAGRR